MQRSLKKLREDGYLPWITEHYNSYARLTQDLWTFVDILCLREEEILAVQTTSYSNVAARVKKITGSEHIGAVRKAGIRVVVHGWHKKGKEWVCRVVDVS